MREPFFTDGRRKALGQMLLNICQYLVIAAIASEVLKIPLIHRLMIIAIALVFCFIGLKSWPRREER